MSVGAGPSAAGVHQSYDVIPNRVRAWVDKQLDAPVHTAMTQAGGMSPGCAARLRTADGRGAFVKAVGSVLNPRTPELFRHEITVLSHLAPAPYRPDVLATYDDGDWVALLLADVDGRHPDLSDPVEADAVWTTVAAQSRELTPPPAGLAVDTLADGIRVWAGGWTTMADDPAPLPPWAQSRVGEFIERLTTLPDRMPTESLCHWDVRDDNLLLRADGTVAIVDWGMARFGPAWADLFMLCLAWVDQPEFDLRVADVGADTVTVTDLLLAIGGWLALRSTQPAPPGLPTLPEFQRRESRRILTGAHRRLHP
ncbi:MAG TPA: aminoglycoside phosphotransferase family protein [Nocardioidaceae bacterium]|nr:aminoglycoside phosphotransferase family protein [Nocardioidaceae bacterium]